MLVAPVVKIVALLAAQLAIARALTPPSAAKAKEVYMPSMLATIWQRLLPHLTRVWPTTWRQLLTVIFLSVYVLVIDHCRSRNSILSQ